MKKVLYSSLFLLAFIACSNPEKTADKPKETAPYVAPDFPEDWLGTYTGKLVLPNPEQTDSIGVMLELLPTDTAGTWVWRMTYEASKMYPKTVKDYRLRHTADMPAHRYLMDEGGGLVLQETYIDKTFYSYYSMGKSLYTVRTKKTAKDELDFEITVVGLMPIDTVVDNIYNHPTMSVQKAILKRTK